MSASGFQRISSTFPSLLPGWNAAIEIKGEKSIEEDPPLLSPAIWPTGRSVTTRYKGVDSPRRFGTFFSPRGFRPSLPSVPFAALSHTRSLLPMISLSIYRLTLGRHFCLPWRRIVAEGRGYATETGREGGKLIFLGEPWNPHSRPRRVDDPCHFVSYGIAGIPAGYTRESSSHSST